MSIKLMTMVFDRYQIGEGEKLVALCLADFASDDGRNIFPSVSTIAKKTCMTERNVQLILKKMQSRGWLICVYKSLGGKPSEYAISNTWINGSDVISNPETSFTVNSKPRNNFTVKSEASNPETSFTDTPKLATHTPKLATSNPETSFTQSIIEPPLEPSYNHHITTNAHEALPVWLDVELWNDWLDSRKKLKAQNSPRALSIILKKLSEWKAQGFNPNSLIETSLVNGWKDCYPPKQTNGNRNSMDDGFADFVAQTERMEARSTGYTNGKMQTGNVYEGVLE